MPMADVSSDEQLSSVWLTACSDEQFQCDMGLCVPLTTWCDGYRDCPDNSDERPTCNGSMPSFVELTQEMIKMPPVPGDELFCC